MVIMDAGIEDSFAVADNPLVTLVVVDPMAVEAETCGFDGGLGWVSGLCALVPESDEIGFPAVTAVLAPPLALVKLGARGDEVLVNGEEGLVKKEVADDDPVTVGAGSADIGTLLTDPAVEPPFLALLESTIPPFF